jgi:S1-C subfamily serine protease
MNVRFLTIPIIVVLSIARPAGLPLRSASVSPPDFDKIAKSVLSVSSSDCADKQTREATGFVWNKPNAVVTALHVVAGCTKLTVKFGESGGMWPATVDRVLKKADLALLTITAPELPAMVTSDAQLQPDEDLWTWGFQRGAPTPSERRFQKLRGSKTLRDFVSKDVADEIKSSGMPDLDTEIVYISGLVQGLSGAPIVNASGAVVGIGDGGLNGGSYGINWAIPQKYLSELLNSSDNSAAVRNMNTQQFSLDRPQLSGAATTVNCGGTIFTQLPDINLGDAVRGTRSDSMEGLMQLIDFYRVSPSESFHVFQNFESGATFVLPTTATPLSDASNCTAKDAAAPITFTIMVQRYGSHDDGVSLTDHFGPELFSPNKPGQWELDGDFTSPPPLQERFDGFEAQRVGWVRSLPGFVQPQELAFMTVALKRGTFLGVLVNVPAEYIFDPRVQFCFANRNVPGCRTSAQPLVIWANSKVAIHLATFPIG